MNIPKPIMDLIMANYGSLDEPRFDFVKRSISKQPYKKLISELSQNFGIEDTTDSNYDVSFSYLVTESDDEQWVVELSMLGRFATVLSLSCDHPQSVKLINDPETFSEKMIFKILSSHAVEIVPINILELPVALRLEIAQPDNVCVYQALFTDSDVLPWRCTGKITQ